MDIVVTIPKNEYANDEAETRDYLEDRENVEHFWTLNKRPKKLNVGDRVFFIKNGRIESSMKVTSIEMDAMTTCETTGRTWKGKCQIFMSDLRFENLDILVKGFQGFRYRWW